MWSVSPDELNRFYFIFDSIHRFRGDKLKSCDKSVLLGCSCVTFESFELTAGLCILMPRCLLCGCPKLAVYNKTINSFDILFFTRLLWLELLFSWLMRMAIGNPLIFLPTRVCNFRSNHFVADVNFVMRNTRFMTAGFLTDCFIA